MAAVSIMKTYGFTLIELSVTLMIISILAMIAYPTFSYYIVKMRRIEAQVALLRLASRMEQYYFENNSSYAAASLATLKVPTKTESGYYQLAILAANQSSYLLQATPTFADPACRHLRLNQLGERSGISDSTVAECW